MTALMPHAAALVAGEANALRRFVDEWLANRRLSDHTRAAYRADVDLWAAWCTQRGLHPLHATFVDVNAWGRDLEEPDPETGRRAAASSVARRLSAVSSFYDFLVRLGAIATNPAAAADRPRVDRGHSTTVGFGEQEARALLATAAAGDRYIGAAGPPVTAVLVDLGLRVSELCGLDVEDLGHDSGHRTVTVRMKGGKRRVRSLPPAVSATLDRYLAARAAQAGVDVAQLHGPLLVDRRGARLDRHAVYRFVRRLAKAAGLPNAARITPHSFRHAWNTMARGAGAELEDRQHAMGHADPRTTQRYDQLRGRLDRDPAWLVAAATSAP